MTPDENLDGMLRTLGAATPRLPPATREAVLARVLDDEAPAGAVSALPLAPRHSRRRIALVALGVAAAAAAAGLLLAPRFSRAPSLSPPRDLEPQNIAPRELEATRLTGNKNITPDDATKTQILRDGKDKIVAAEKLCVAPTGRVVSVQVMKPSGYPAYDDKILAEIRTWTYAPRAALVCTAVTFIYSQK